MNLLSQQLPQKQGLRRSVCHCFEIKSILSQQLPQKQGLRHKRAYQPVKTGDTIPATSPKTRIKTPTKSKPRTAWSKLSQQLPQKQGLTNIAGGQQFINRYEVYVKINIADY